jgi:hypothetical protein
MPEGPRDTSFFQKSHTLGGTDPQSIGSPGLWNVALVTAITATIFPQTRLSFRTYLCRCSCIIFQQTHALPSGRIFAGTLVLRFYPQGRQIQCPGRAETFDCGTSPVRISCFPVCLSERIGCKNTASVLCTYVTASFVWPSRCVPQNTIVMANKGKYRSCLFSGLSHFLSHTNKTKKNRGP